MLEIATSVATAVAISIAAAWLGLLRAVRHTGYGIALMSICATIIHEACHLVIGLVLNAKPVSISLIPKKQANRWVLGSVGFENLNLWNAAFVTMAPLAMLPLGAGMLQHWMVPAIQSGKWVHGIALGYLVACCFFAGWPSRTDFRLGATSILVYATLGYGLWKL